MTLSCATILEYSISGALVEYESPQLKSREIMEIRLAFAIGRWLFSNAIAIYTGKPISIINILRILADV
jgi:hypothetical protein